MPDLPSDRIKLQVWSPVLRHWKTAYCEEAKVRLNIIAFMHCDIKVRLDKCKIFAFTSSKSDIE
jgi:hypothetical protein